MDIMYRLKASYLLLGQAVVFKFPMEATVGQLEDSY